MHAVVVYEWDKVGESGGVGGERGFPYGAFVALAVSHYYEYSAVSAVFFECVGHTRSCGESMPERTCGEIDAWDMMGYVPGEPAAVGVVCLEFLDRDEAAFCKRRVALRSGVAFAQYHPVASVPFGIF